MRQPPKVILTYMREFSQSEEEARQYILEQKDFFDRIPEPTTDFNGWLAFKFGITSRTEAARAYGWAARIRQSPSKPPSTTKPNQRTRTTHARS